MQTIVETPEFLKKSSSLTEFEKRSVINYLAAHPLSGDLIKGTGGIRKIRWSVGNKGKSGGVRLIYFFHNNTIPLFLLTMFKKGQKDNISESERNELSELTKILIKSYGAKK